MVNAPAPYVGDTQRSPVAICTIASLVCAFLGIGVMAAYLPDEPPLSWPAAFLTASVLLLAAAALFLQRRPRFAWRLFWSVARWVFVGTLIFSATAVFVFVYDGTRGPTLAIMAAVLVLTAIDIPLLIAFSVARHERATER